MSKIGYDLAYRNNVFVFREISIKESAAVDLYVLEWDI